MYELNSQTFRQLLEAVPEDTAENEFAKIDPYLMDKVCSPILNRQPLIPNQIDYSRFTLEDLYDLLDEAQAYYHHHFRLWELNQNLCSQPVPQSLQRAFC